jgi:tropomyosin-1
LQKEVDRLEDELIIAKEHFAEIGDDLDFTFVDLIDGIPPIWSYRRPKPPTPPPREKTPPSEVKKVETTVEGVPVEGAAIIADGQAPTEGALAAAPSAPKEPSPFELKKHFPPDGAEVPFVKSFETAPETAPEPPKPVEEPPKAEEPAPAPEVPAEQPAVEAPTETPVETPVETPAAEQPAQEEAPAPASDAPAE